MGKTRAEKLDPMRMKALVSTARDILKDNRHWSLVDVADRAEAAVGLARAVLEAVGEDEDECPPKCKDCREHAENVGDDDEDEEDDVKKAVKKAVESVVADGDALRAGKTSLPGRFVQVEYDRSYSGGDYDGWNSSNAYLELVDGLCDENVEERFEKATGADRANIISYNFDELYVRVTKETAVHDVGEFVPEDEIDEDES